MHTRVEKRMNPWERDPIPDEDISADDLYYLRNLAFKRLKFRDNLFLDIDTKRAALKAAPSVVALVSYTGEEELIQGSGTIIESDEINRGIVLTSANLIRRPNKEELTMENSLADNLKVVVYRSDGKSYEGQIFAYDFHYNIVAIRFQSDSPLPTARLRHVDDSISISPSQLSVPEESFENLPHSSRFSLVPGDKVIAMGRYFTKPFDLMAAPGEFSLDRCEYDCKELFMATCNITRCGEGGPLINLSGEVIGVMFYDLGPKPFMPINIAYKWWEHYKRCGELRRPFLGMEATNLYAAELRIMEKVIHRFPLVCKGVLVEQVTPGSSADASGIRPDDVIFRCDEKRVQSFLELFEIMWDKVGSTVELIVIRADHDTPLHFNMLVAEATPDKLNSWPGCDYR